MRRISTFSALVMGGLVVAACGGNGEAMEESTAAASDMDAAAADALECYLARGTMAEAQRLESL